jgi:valyl-tRNA synthetase
MAAGSRLGDDLGFPEKDVVTGKKTVTKLFNAAKFAHLHLEDYDPKEFNIEKLKAIDKGLLTKLSNTIQEATAFFEEFNFSRAKAAIDIFFWQDFCDNYLEIAKDRLYKPEVHGKDAQRAAQMTTYYALYALLRLYAPFVPFITEEVYSWNIQKHIGKPSVHLTSWPQAEFHFTNELAAWEEAKTIISLARQTKNQHEVSQKHEFVQASYAGNKDLLSLVQDDIDMTIKVSNTATSTITSSDDISFAGTLAPKQE